MRTPLHVIIILCLVQLPAVAFSAVPTMINYQGVITDASGKSISNQTLSIVFTIYDDVISTNPGNVLWTQTRSVGTGANGEINTFLGSQQNPITENLFAGDLRYLGIKVGSDPEMFPRTRLLSVPFAFRPGTVDGASGGEITGDLFVGSVGNPPWLSNNLYIENSGGNAANTFRLDGFSNDFYIIANSAPGASVGTGIRFRTASAGGGDIDRMYIDATGNVGIGTTSPYVKLDVNGNVNAGFLSVTGLYCPGSGSINIASIGTAHIDNDATIGGRTTTGVLEITGGSDLAEPFNTSDGQRLPEGAVVVIDDEHEGMVRMSGQTYDSKVAGVISGAGGINPGLTLTQTGLLESGQNVALSGRVYVLATATNGNIVPGDLLTTSGVPGHAMKATDRSRSHGAIIGKAMTALGRGEGLVLVLVNLQ